MKRRALLIASVVAVVGARTAGAQPFDVVSFDRARVLAAADRYLNEQPVTVTATRAARSAGGPHDFFSEGDYWWPDPKNPDGPYLRRDGQTNPDNFDEHRKAMRRLSVQAPALAAAWKITKQRKYADHAVRHLVAWFVDPATRMNPSLEYSQAIKGRFKGRATGVIDTIHLIEVARAAEVLKDSGAATEAQWQGVVSWFKDYLHWLVTHPYGIEERDAKNNHGTCWVAQAAAFAHLTGDRPVMDFCRKRYQEVLVPEQMTGNGSFPMELTRTKPYGYSLFNLEAMSTVCQVLSTAEDDLWRWELPDARGIRTAVAFMFPYIRDKRTWPLTPDVQYFDNWPMRQSALLFAGLHFGKPAYLEVWKTLPADSDVDEVIRNFFIRQPVLWVD